MVIFDLACVNGHSFEGWFEDKKDLEDQIAQGRLQCPFCETSSIVKKVHPVSIKTSGSSFLPEEHSLPAEEEILSKMARHIVKKMETEFEDVGASFADQALKMHYGACEHKNIRGTTTREEEKMLAKEGVPVFKLPIPNNPKKDLN